MEINMNDSRLININQLKGFLKGSQGLDLSLRKAGIEKKYQFIDKTVDRLNYPRLNRKEKRIVLAYLKKITGYKRAQLTRLVNRAKKGKLVRKKYHRVNPSRKYSAFDIKLLEKTDEFHLRLNTIATRTILRREIEVFGKTDYQIIAQISPSHINNLRKHPVYRNTWVNHTKPRIIPIGMTKPPEDYGRPGSLRVDSVHQRDLYHINAVDVVTQWEIVFCVPMISEHFLKPALEIIVDQCPFIIFNFHSDRGSEYINYLIARLLNKLHITQTKSRSRHPNDNALAETKNGSVIRKNMGWEYLAQESCQLINQYYEDFFNSYLNYHRPCLFQSRITKDKKGRQRIVYEEATVPYEKLKEVSQLKKKNFLKPGLTFDELDKIAYQCSDNDFARRLREAERKLFREINKINKRTAGKSSSRQKTKP